VLVLPVLLWAFFWLSGTAAPYLQKNVLRVYLWFYRSWTAFLLLSCHSSPCRNMDVLARYSLLAAMQVFLC
jgi:hypothetical protein